MLEQTSDNTPSFETKQARATNKQSNSKQQLQQPMFSKRLTQYDNYSNFEVA
jgi:hypothetical protein